MEPRDPFQGMNSASQYDNPIPPRFLALIDSLKIPVLATQAGGTRIHSFEWIPGLHKQLKIRALEHRLWEDGGEEGGGGGVDLERSKYHTFKNI
jgi:hypothetical protein